MTILERMYIDDPARFAPMPSRVSAQEAEAFRCKLQAVSPELAEEFRYLWGRLCFQQREQLAALFAQGARLCGAVLILYFFMVFLSTALFLIMGNGGMA